MFFFLCCVPTTKQFALEGGDHDGRASLSHRTKVGVCSPSRARATEKFFFFLSCYAACCCRPIRCNYECNTVQLNTTNNTRASACVFSSMCVSWLEFFFFFRHGFDSNHFTSSLHLYFMDRRTQEASTVHVNEISTDPHIKIHACELVAVKAWILFKMCFVVYTC